MVGQSDWLPIITFTSTCSVMAIPFPPGQERAELSRFGGSIQEQFKNLWTHAKQFDSIDSIDSIDRNARNARNARHDSIGSIGSIGSIDSNDCIDSVDSIGSINL